MSVKFEIEAKWKMGKGKDVKYFVFAKCLNKKKDFSVTNYSRLNEVEISNYLSQPRALDKNGEPRLDIFLFKIRFKKDCDKLNEGQIVELIHDKKKVMEEIFFSVQDESTERFIVIDEIENSIWVYLTFPNEKRIDKDCFLGSRDKIEIEEFDFEKYKKRQIPPPMIKQFSTKESQLSNLKEEDISVEWRKNGNAILKINGNPFLFFTDDEGKGFSKSISKNGIYGNKWKTEKFNEKFRKEKI